MRKAVLVAISKLWSCKFMAKAEDVPQLVGHERNRTIGLVAHYQLTPSPVLARKERTGLVLFIALAFAIYGGIQLPHIERHIRIRVVALRIFSGNINEIDVDDRFPVRSRRI